jgi:hypothetical protein
VSGLRRVVFTIGYDALVMASALSYLVRGRRDIAVALLAGRRAAARSQTGAPPDSLFAESGYAGSGGASGQGHAAT